MTDLVAALRGLGAAELVAALRGLGAAELVAALGARLGAPELVAALGEALAAQALPQMRATAADVFACDEHELPARPLLAAVAKGPVLVALVEALGGLFGGPLDEQVD